jgi:hypothetical protein
MFIGHYAPAFVAATLPKAPRLGTLFIAAQLVDFAFFLFVIFDIEQMRITPGITAMNALDLYAMPYTHSLLGSIVFGAAFAVIVWTVQSRYHNKQASFAQKGATAALIAGTVVVSHWFLDLLVHAPDLTLAGSPPKMGIGLWNYPLAEMPLELGITGAALGFYLSRTRPVPGANMAPVFWLSGTMLMVQMYNWLAPEPETMDMTLPVSALLAFGLFTWLAYRMDRRRSPKTV